MAKEKVFVITHLTGEKIKAEINWIDKEAKLHSECGNHVSDKGGTWCETCECFVDKKDIIIGHFGVSFIDKYPHNEGGDVLTFAGKGKEWCFK